MAWRKTSGQKAEGYTWHVLKVEVIGAAQSESKLTLELSTAAEAEIRD